MSIQELEQQRDFILWILVRYPPVSDDLRAWLIDVELARIDRALEKLRKVTRATTSLDGHGPIMYNQLIVGWCPRA
jgi:hypothetical protein